MTKNEVYELPTHQIMEWLTENIKLTEQQLLDMENLDDSDFRDYVRDNFAE
jgi:hypothetical protein